MTNNGTPSFHANGKNGTKITLSRNLSLFSITMIGVGGMIGAGIFVLTGTAAGVAGPAVILAFLLNGIVTSLTAMSYAELGSAFPEAGGGYLWVKEGLGGLNGFLAGWMSWFAHAVAGSLYALAFGRFFSEMWLMVGLPLFGFSVEQLPLIFMVLIVLLFVFINYLGVSEAGKIGNIVTVVKIVILIFFVIFGVIAMLRMDNWSDRFTGNFMPFGLNGVFVAMGLTFIAFEGYEIIAQSGEEAINPKRNIPRAIFLAIGIAVTIYILVGITSIGVITTPGGIPAYEYLGLKKETAVIEVASQTFPWGIGAVVLLISGLVSTMSALNATTYSSSRVSFAMGRDHNLPSIFATIHPKRHTPYIAVIFSGLLMIVMGLLLPIDDVAASADIMFLLLFLQVNVAVMTLRKKRPDLDRGFKVPFFPVIPLIAILLNSMLAIYLFTFSSIAWYFAIGWISIGLIAYYGYFSRIEAMEKPKEILLEEALVSRDYSVLVPVVDQDQARIMGEIGSIIAEANSGEVLALNVIRVPWQLTLSEGRLFLKEGRNYLEPIIEQAKKRDVPVHTMIRLGRDVVAAMRTTIYENATDLLLLGWPGKTDSGGRMFGSVIDPLVDNPPCDVAVVRYRKQKPIRKILVPVSGGPNSRLAVKLAMQMGSVETEGPALVVLMHVISSSDDARAQIRANQIFASCAEGFDYPETMFLAKEGTNVVETVLNEAEGEDASEPYDMIVIGATLEPLFKNLLAGNIATQIINKASMTVVMVKVRSGPLRSILRQTVLPESTSK